MFDILTSSLFSPGQHWWPVALALVVVLVMGLALGWRFGGSGLRRQKKRLESALDQMSQGLAMFDGQARLILVNEHYLQMYGLSPEQAKPGCSLRDLFEQRLRVGTFKGDADRYLE